MKIKTNVFLQWLCCNGFRFFRLSTSTNKVTIFPDNGLYYTGRYRAVNKDFKAKGKTVLALWNFSRWLRGSSFQNYLESPVNSRVSILISQNSE